jgi:TnpA family transposase
LVALAIEGNTVTDEIIDLHDRIIGKLFNAASINSSSRLPARRSTTRCGCMGASSARCSFWIAASVELRRRVHAGLNKGEALDDTLLQYLSLLGGSIST